MLAQGLQHENGLAHHKDDQHQDSRQHQVDPAQPAHAFVQAFKEAPELSPDDAVIINMSGRGDKDIFTIAQAFDDPSWKDFIIQRAAAYQKTTIERP